MTGLRLLPALLLAGSTCLFACSDDSKTIAARAGRDAGDGGDRDGGRPVRDAGEQDAGSAGPCVVALRIDDCCGRYEPLRRAEVEADECLQAVPASTVFGADLVERCMTKAAASCDPARCNPPPPAPSRIAVADGAGCRFADECSEDSDCAPGLSIAGCCHCAKPLPAALFELNECVVPEGTPTREWPLGCPGCDLPVSCTLCAESKAPSCEKRGSFNLCSEAR